MKVRWNELGGQLGIGFIVVGLILIFFGWNGAASLDRVPSQFPYLISGGIAGMSLVFVGVGLMVIQNQRADRAQLQHALQELRAALDRLGQSAGASEAGEAQLREEAELAGLVIAGPHTYHRPTCRLLSGRGVMPTMTAEEAESRGLTACRTCAAAEVVAAEPAAPRRSRKRPAKKARSGR